MANTQRDLIRLQRDKDRFEAMEVPESDSSQSSLQHPGEWFAELAYQAEGAPDSAEEIQYIRVPLRAGTTFNNMRYFQASGGGSDNIRMGIYDQTDVTDGTLGPNDLVASTVATATAGMISDSSLTSRYPIPKILLRSSDARMILTGLP